MAGAMAIQGVDQTLSNLSLKALTPAPGFPGVPGTTATVGPLDRDEDTPRVNWFLYRIDPNPAYANMEPPRSGWRTARGRPPLALQLHYLLSAHPAPLTLAGDQDQIAHWALGAVMQAVHEHGIIAEGDPVLSPLATPLVEPLRIVMSTLDLEAVTKLWTAASRPIRLAVGYEVSLVVIDSVAQHQAGPPVRTRRLAVAPAMGPRFTSVTPSRVSAGIPFTVAASGLTSGAVFTLARELSDPAGPDGGWPLVVAPSGPGQVTLTLTETDLTPGDRHVHLSEVDNGLAVGAADIGVVLVPAIISAPASAAHGSTVTLATVHAAPGVEVFLSGHPVPAVNVNRVSFTQVDLTIPPAAATGPSSLALRAATVPGPAVSMTVTP